MAYNRKCNICTKNSFFFFFAGQLQLEDDLIASRSELAKVQSYLATEQENVSLLNHQVDDLLSKYTEDITVRDNLIKQLNVELNSKANAIVLLTQQIHRVRTELKQDLESRASKSVVCSCPHCCIHSKSLESKKQQRALCLQEKKRRKVDHRHTHLHDTEQNSLASTVSAVSGILTRHFNPAPPLSPPPPSSATGWRHGIVRRASTPVRINSWPTDTHTIPSCNQMGTVQDDHTHNIHRTRTQHIQSQSVRGSSYGIGRERTLSQDQLQQVLSLKYFEEENRVIHTQLVCRNSPAILPPIIASPLSNAEHLEQNDSCNDSGSRRVVSSHLPCQDLDMVVDSSILQHRHPVSYKSSALSNASSSSLCILRRTGRCRSQMERGVVSKKTPGSHGPEGILLVKESGKKLSSTTTLWEKGTLALD